MKILVISGFLGAGKTTFIKEMVKSTGREYVIFENEFGDVNIDGEILKNKSEITDEKEIELNVWELTSGCACCSTKADFMSSLLAIDNTLNPDFLIVAGTYFKYKNKYEEVFMDQVKMATHIQFSKVENISKEELNTIFEDIRKINQNAEIHTSDYHNQDISYWNSLFSGELVKMESSDLIDVKKKMQNVSYKNACAKNPAALAFFLDKLILGYYGDINRAKGVFRNSDYNMHFDVVDTGYNIYFSEGEAENNTVFIGNPIDKGLLLKELEEMTAGNSFYR